MVQKGLQIVKWYYPGTLTRFQESRSLLTLDISTPVSVGKELRYSGGGSAVLLTFL